MSLQEEYAQLLSEKRESYHEMKEILTVKANVERMLCGDGQDKQTEKEQTTDKPKRISRLFFE